METYKAYYDSPVGAIEITATESGILSLDFVDEIKKFDDIPEILKNCLLELDEYFKGKRREFTINCELSGTMFQKKVWKALTEIPFGRTMSYKEIAEKIGNPKAVRAVGSANHNNKIAIIIPCHRVIGSSGRLTGYAGGLWRKEWLLNHEKL